MLGGAQRALSPRNQPGREFERELEPEDWHRGGPRSLEMQTRQDQHLQ